MCVGIPMRIVAADGLKAEGQRLDGADGAAETISLALTGPVEPGAFVLVHIASAVRVLEREEAQQIADALTAVAAAARGQPFDHLLADLIDREPQLPPGLRPEDQG